MDNLDPGERRSTLENDVEDAIATLRTLPSGGARDFQLDRAVTALSALRSELLNDDPRRYRELELMIEELEQEGTNQ